MKLWRRRRMKRFPTKKLNIIIHSHHFSLSWVVTLMWDINTVHHHDTHTDTHDRQGLGSCFSCFPFYFGWFDLLPTSSSPPGSYFLLSDHSWFVAFLFLLTFCFFCFSADLPPCLDPDDCLENKNKNIPTHRSNRDKKTQVRKTYRRTNNVYFYSSKCTLTYIWSSKCQHKCEIAFFLIYKYKQ